MLLILFRIISFIIFKSFAYSCHLLLCFMPTYTLEVDMRNYKDPKVLLSLYETMNYKGLKTRLSLYETMNNKGLKTLLSLYGTMNYKGPKALLSLYETMTFIRIPKVL